LASGSRPGEKFRYFLQALRGLVGMLFFLLGFELQFAELICQVDPEGTERKLP
jgi:hypothetical protein